jgi:transcriptional regulator with XRE-family HTH domain
MDRAALGRTLAAARARLGPADAGLPAGPRRRVAGLRREEVALLAGISVDYLVRLEQGRGPTPSDQVLTALARALRLTRDERDHLFALAGASPPLPGHIDGVVRPSTLRLLDRMTDLPAMVLDAKGDLLAWNAMATALLGDFTAVPPDQRNFVRRHFLGPRGRTAHDPAEEERNAAESVADLRAVAARYPDDPGLGRLLAALEGSAEFRRLWAASRPAGRKSSRKTLHHPQVGALLLDCDLLLLPDTDQRLIVYSAPPGTPAAAGLALLRVVGLQDLTPARGHRPQGGG